MRSRAQLAGESDLLTTQDKSALQPSVAGRPDVRLIDRIAVTVMEAAELVGTNDKQIRKAIYARELPVVRLGNSYLIAVEDLIRWFNSKKGKL